VWHFERDWFELRVQKAFAMVTASKVEAQGYSVGTGLSAASTAPPQEEIDYGSVDGDEGFSMRASSLCYGEQLVLDTYLRTRNRPYNRERQEELAKPRKRGGISASWHKGQGQCQMMAQMTPRQPSRPAQPQKPPREPSEGEYSSDDGWVDNKAGQEELQGPLPLLRNRVTPRAPADIKSVVERLAKPKVIKRDKVAPGEEQVLLYLKDIRQKGEKTDIREVIGRLATPKVQRPLSPTPGERVVLNYNMTMQGRRCNRKRIDQLAVAPPRRCFLGVGKTFRNVHEAALRAENEVEELDGQVALDIDFQDTPEQASQTHPPNADCMTDQADAYNREQRNADEDDPNCRGASGGSYAGGTSATLETDAGRSSPISSPPSSATTYPPSSATTPARTGTSGTCGGGGIPNLPEVPSGSPTMGSGGGGAAPSSTPRGRAPGTWRSGVDGKA